MRLSMSSARTSGAVLSLLALSLAGCQGAGGAGGRAGGDAQTSLVNAFTYPPINPLTVFLQSGDDNHDGVPASGYQSAFLTDFANDATRVAMAKVNAKGTLSYGPVSATVTGETYSMIIDYIKYMTLSVPVRVFEA